MKLHLDKFIAAVHAAAPLLTLLPGGDKLAPFIPAVTGAIITAEQIPGLSGPEKKAAVEEIARTSIAVANATGKTHIDPQAAAAVVSHGIDTIIGTVRLVHQDPAPVNPAFLQPPTATPSS